MDVQPEHETVIRGRAFTRQSGLGMGVTAVLMVGGMVGLHLSTGVIRARRTTTLAIEHTEQQIADIVALTADREALEADVAGAIARRGDVRILQTDPETTLRDRCARFCERADLRFDGLALLPPRRRAALEAVPVRLAFAGAHPQVPVLLDAFFAQPELLPVTSLELEVVNFVDDRITGTLGFDLIRLRPPTTPNGEVLRPFLPVSCAPTLLSPESATLDDARERLHSEYWGLLDHEALLEAREHYASEERQLMELTENQAQAQTDVARAMPQLIRALDRSALGRAGFRIAPGGAVEFTEID